MLVRPNFIKQVKACRQDFVWAAKPARQPGYDRATPRRLEVKSRRKVGQTHITTNAFIDHNPKGFGLLQRDRKFDHYLDDDVFYNKRPSVWVEPIGEWGEGAVHLVEMPTGEETWDNVVAYWYPTSFRKAGENRIFKYKLTLV